MKQLCKRGIALALLTCILLTFVLVPVRVKAETPDGWVKSGSYWTYYQDGTKLCSQWIKDGYWYYLDSNGHMTTGWQKVSGKWYYMNASGAMQTGWQQIGGKWYYLGTNGAMTTGWQKVSGKWYYMNANGAMTTGWQKISGKWYYLGTNGAMQTGWVQLSGKWYYLASNGVMTTGWQQIGGKWYYMNANGAMLSGWQQIDGEWYYLKNEMKTGWQYISGKWYYLKNAMQTGWQQIGGKWYYLGTNGAMVTGTQVIDGMTYVFNSGGALTSPAAPYRVITQPQTSYCDIGDTASFTVEAAGGTGPYTYTWQISAYGSNWADLYTNEGWANGYDTDTLSFEVTEYEFSSSTGEANFDYRCKITDAEGNVIYSQPANVEKKVYIDAQPADLGAQVGDEVTFSVTAGGGVAPYTYRWQVSSAYDSQWRPVIYDTGTNVLRFDIEGDLILNCDYLVRCIVTDARGDSVTSDAASLYQGMRITVQPENDVASPGGQANFYVTVADGVGPYTYQWQWCDYSQPWQDVSGSWASGAKTSQLDIVVDQDEIVNEVKYRCVITDVYGNTVISDTVWVEDPFRIVTQPKSAVSSAGVSTSFAVKVAGGSGSYTYKWQYSMQITESPTAYFQTCTEAAGFSGQNTGTLTIPSPSGLHTGYTYRCIITDSETGDTLTSTYAYLSYS